MEIIALTEDGYLITATKTDIREILKAVLGGYPEVLEIGQKIPAIDYAATITKVKNLETNYDFARLLQAAGGFYKELENLREKIRNASRIEIL